MEKGVSKSLKQPGQKYYKILEDKYQPKVIMEKKTKHQYFHSLCFYPQDRFDGQHPNEEIILKLRAHPITQIYWLLNSVVFILLILIVDYVFFGFLTFKQFIFINLLAFGWIGFYFISNFTHWYFSIGIVTNERIIDVDYNALLNREITVAKLGKIEDITSKSSGFFSSIFDYGNLFIQTAGTEANIEFINIPKPGLTAKIINEIINKNKPNVIHH